MTSNEDELLKAVALRNASTVLKLRLQAEEDLVQAKLALEQRTEELALSLAMMKATLDSATDAILVTDGSDQVTAFNEKFAQMWPMPTEMLQRGSLPTVSENMSRHFVDPAGFVKSIVGGRNASKDTSDTLVRTDGRIIERLSRPQVLEGRVVGRVWNYRDVTEQRRAEEALRDETRVLELLNQTGQNLASELDLQALVQAVTDAGTQISGARFGAFFYNVTNAEGDSFVLYTLTGASREAFEKIGYPRATALFGATFRGEPPIRSDDVLQDPRYGKSSPHFGMPSGHLPVRSYLAVPVISRSGEVIGGLFFGHPEPGVFNERSERMVVGIAAQAAVAIDNARLYEAAQKAAEEREKLLVSERSARALAERISVQKDDFLATLSHELRTPLSAILGWVHIMRRVNGPADLKKGLDTIERNSRMQAQLIDDLLDMNRISSGKVRLDIQPVDPLSFIEAALEAVRPAAEAKQIRIVRLLDPSVGPLPGDPARLQQVMANLLSNAIKFTPRNGSVQVFLERVNSFVEVTVADTGIGIKPEFVDQVFERFRQADSTTARQYGGLGLGLSIVKSLVELHGGNVHAKSAGEGKGAVFTVRLPVPLVSEYAGGVERVHPRGVEEIAPPFHPIDLSGLKILVVDDDDDGCDLARRILEDCHAEVFVASDAAQALQMVQAHQPDLMISDIGMPNVDGYELLRRVRALGQSRGGGLIAIALTAFARSQDRVQALHAGFTSHLAKPVQPSELLATVASAGGRVGRLGRTPHA